MVGVRDEQGWIVTRATVPTLAQTSVLLVRDLDPGCTSDAFVDRRCDRVRPVATWYPQPSEAQRNVLVTMTPLHDLLADFFDRVRPLGVAFVGPPSLSTTFGRPPNYCSSMWEDSKGFLQYHLEESDISVYASSFGWGKYLIAQFLFQAEYPPPQREWLAFVRLASAVMRIIEHPEEAQGSGDAGVAVRRPTPRSPRTRAAEAPLFDHIARP